MNRLLGTFLALAALAAILPTVSAPARAASNPITVSQCFIIQPKPLSKLAGGTQIAYVNNSRKTATSVTFVVGYRNAENHFLRRVTDVGQFTPGTPIDHRFDLYNDITYAGKQTSSCYASSVKFIDGTSWSG